MSDQCRNQKQGRACVGPFLELDGHERQEQNGHSDKFEHRQLNAKMVGKTQSPNALNRALMENVASGTRQKQQAHQTRRYPVNHEPFAKRNFIEEIGLPLFGDGVHYGASEGV